MLLLKEGIREMWGWTSLQRLGQDLRYGWECSGIYSQLLTFPAAPGHGERPLIAASDGNLYGSFSEGGANGRGEIYKATLAGQFQIVASFPAPGMADPWTLMQAADGNIYGTTNYNQIFRYGIATHQLTQVYQLASIGHFHFAQIGHYHFALTTCGRHMHKMARYGIIPTVATVGG